MTQFYARLAVRPEAQQKAAILASKAVRWKGFEVIGDFVEFVIDDAWQEALQAGKVDEDMLKPVEVAEGAQ